LHPPLLSLTGGRRYQPHSIPIVRNVRERGTSASRKESAFHVAPPSETQAKNEAWAIGGTPNTEWLTAIQTEKTSCGSGNPVRAATRRAGRGATCVRAL
jgi:hypothetical protein